MRVHFAWIVSLLFVGAFVWAQTGTKSHIQIRGVYGGSPSVAGDGTALADFGVNAIFIHSGSLTPELVSHVKNQGARIFAEFNTMHFAKFLETHPEAAPIGADGKVSPPPEGWQGVCPNHEGYRENRMTVFRELLEQFELDGIWLDYHHAHASWERDVPLMPDTCFCERCLRAFQSDTGIELPGATASEKAQILLTRFEGEWVRWRCGVFTDWVREFREIIDQKRPGALLGTYHCPWSLDDYDGALMKKLAIDLKGQLPYIDVFSPMPYHARFGYVKDPEWIARQVKWLGDYLGLEGKPGERIKIWPIVQLSDWGESVPPEQVIEVLDLGSRLPATGVMVFAWGSLQKQQQKVNALKEFYLEISR